MSPLKPVPITNFLYEHFVQAPFTLLLLDVKPTPRQNPGVYDVDLIFRGYANIYRFETCIRTGLKLACKPVSVGGYNSLALKLSNNGRLLIEPHPHNPYRVRLTYANKNGQLGSILVPLISIMPFFYEAC